MNIGNSLELAIKYFAIYHNKGGFTPPLLCVFMWVYCVVAECLLVELESLLADEVRKVCR